MIFCIENYYFEVENEEIQTSFPHPTYGTITANIIHLNNTVFAYSVGVIVNNDSLSDSCAVLLTDNFGDLIATTKFLRR